MSSSPALTETLRLDRQDPYLRVLCVNVYVRDQDRSLRFFVNQLGFRLVVDESYDSGDRWVAVAPPDGNTVLALVTPQRKSEERKLIGRSRHTVLATEDVMAKYDEWNGRGVRFHHPPQTTLWGGIFTRFDDVDGNTFMLVSHDKFVRDIETRRRAAAEKLEAERRAAQELEIAKQVQARLFPQILPQLKTLEYAGACIQARAVGGDYYDFLDLGHETLGLVIADTSGKGIAAALLMANLQANLRSQSAIALDQPQRFLQSVNQLFCKNTVDSAYATLFFGQYNDQARRLRFANCGHYSGILLRVDGTLEQLDSTGTVLGLFCDWDCAIEERQLSPGDLLALYTDGVTEALNTSGEEYGEERLIGALRQKRDQCPQSLLAEIVQDIQRFSGPEQYDDITLMIAKCR